MSTHLSVVTRERKKKNAGKRVQAGKRKFWPNAAVYTMLERCVLLQQEQAAVHQLTGSMEEGTGTGGGRFEEREHRGTERRQE